MIERAAAAIGQRAVRHHDDVAASQCRIIEKRAKRPSRLVLQGAAATRGVWGRDNSSIEGMRVGPELTISQACAQGVPTYPHARAAEMLRAASASLCSVQFAIIQEDGVSAPLRKAGCARLTELSKRPGVIPAQMRSFLEGAPANTVKSDDE